ncbi:rod shape-determining protein MreD, partial [Patescibacteria group bacterium]|nr:rod shape-determining protein MreD [Patescibacteria group bacterium]
MKLSKAVFLFFLFYVLTLIQTSFLIHYSWRGTGINLVLLVFIIFLFNHKKDIKEGVLLAVMAGFFLDIFSSYFFGLFILFFIILFFLISQIRKRILANNLWGYLLVLFSIIIIYYFFFFLISRSFNFFDVIYNFLVGIVIYFILKI